MNEYAGQNYAQLQYMHYNSNTALLYCVQYMWNGKGRKGGINSCSVQQQLSKWLRKIVLPSYAGGLLSFDNNREEEEGEGVNSTSVQQ